MRRLNLKHQQAVYHCMSRTIQGRAFFHRREKEVLRKMIWQVADFSGVRVLTYCIMRNHFHVLVETPEEETPSRQELLRRYGVLYPQGCRFAPLPRCELEAAFAEDGDRAAELEAWLLNRMGDVSEFMRTLKLRFSKWYNYTHETYGAVWAERFKSVLVQGEGHPIRTVAAYIDLNPVRAGLVDDPSKYRFCGFCEASAGERSALRGVERIMRSVGEATSSPLLSYKLTIIYWGEDRAKADCSGALSEAFVSSTDAEGSFKSAAQAFTKRCAFLTSGMLLGSIAFVEAHAGTYQKLRKRKHRPKPRAVEAEGFETLATMIAVTEKD